MVIIFKTPSGKERIQLRMVWLTCQNFNCILFCTLILLRGCWSRCRQGNFPFQHSSAIA